MNLDVQAWPIVALKLLSQLSPSLEVRTTCGRKNQEGRDQLQLLGSDWSIAYLEIRMIPHQLLEELGGRNVDCCFVAFQNLAELLAGYLTIFQQIARETRPFSNDFRLRLQDLADSAFSISSPIGWYVAIPATHLHHVVRSQAEYL